MKKFNIEIKQVQKDIVEIEANSSIEAIEKAKKEFYNAEILLDPVEAIGDVEFKDIELESEEEDER